MPKPPAKNSPETSAPQGGLSGGDIGINLFVSVAVGGGLGYALDMWMGWSPWGLLAGCFLGFGAWLRVVWRVLQKA